MCIRAVGIVFHLKCLEGGELKWRFVVGVGCGVVAVGCGEVVCGCVVVVVLVGCGLVSVFNDVSEAVCRWWRCLWMRAVSALSVE